MRLEFLSIADPSKVLTKGCTVKFENEEQKADVQNLEAVTALGDEDAGEFSEPMDPMDPASYSDIPRGKWSDGLPPLPTNCACHPLAPYPPAPTLPRGEGKSSLPWKPLFASFQICFRY